MKVRKLQQRTGKGVRIGDNESQLVSRLGRPAKIERAGARSDVLIFRYGSGSNSDRRGYDESYTFKSGRLVEIRLASSRDEDED